MGKKVLTDRRMWTEAEDRLLLKTFVRRSPAALAECIRLFPKRSEKAIKVHYYELVNHGRHYRSPRKKARKCWTDASVNALRRYAGVLRRDEVAAMIKMPVSAVDAYATAHGISFEKSEDYYNLEEIADMLDVSAEWVNRRIRNGMLSEHNHRQPHQEHWVTVNSLRDYIRRHPAEINNLVQQGRKPDIILLVEVLAGIIPPKIYGEGVD